MALKHERDKCEVNGILFDGGGLLCVCSCCGETWTIDAPIASQMNDDARATIREALASNAETFRDLDVDVDSALGRL